MSVSLHGMYAQRMPYRKGWLRRHHFLRGKPHPKKQNMLKGTQYINMKTQCGVSNVTLRRGLQETWLSDVIRSFLVQWDLHPDERKGTPPAHEGVVRGWPMQFQHRVPIQWGTWPAAGPQRYRLRTLLFVGLVSLWAFSHANPSRKMKEKR